MSFNSQSVKACLQSVAHYMKPPCIPKRTNSMHSTVLADSLDRTSVIVWPTDQKFLSD